ncbi:glycosyltransferase family 39 protein [Acetobacterium tundrae]|uniref:Dolichyl-phosphate-mannose--protein mannosyltransferase n=1 Tax=Acetobacterium tundrae TaxID=132932 RepID=A0ABR6WN13_9FIRM|nr:glycosyltransferase family 39 protein [Acetobacterium tundrae]MBC3797676.1 dolichyl-phosphate-mannose--protein mannosyltransferase [Acetobacterium tundrae]
MKKIELTREKIILLLIMMMSAFLNFGNLGIQGYGNAYYAAGVKSMTMSWSNFFFVAFDPSGFVTIDKPPLGFWIQALSAKIFGYSGVSILLPEALAGVISVYILYRLVKKSYGSTAALISAFCMATTPIFVAVSKNNTIDGILVLTLLLACLALHKAVESGKLRHVILCLAIVGIGFNVKMLQAYMILPAIYITYFFVSTIPIKKRILQLVAGTLILVVVSLSWATIVDLVPAADRPFVGSSTNNSELELIFGHNGVERLTSTSGSGMGTRGGGMGTSGDGQSRENASGGDTNQASTSQAVQDSSETGQDIPSNVGYGDMSDAPGGMENGQNGNTRGGGMFGGSEPASILRLFSSNSLTDQIIWLFPFAVIGLIAAFLNEKKKASSFDVKKKQGLLLWGMWLVPVFLYFSFTTGLFHPYYLIMLAPPIAALTGIGMVSMWELYQKGGWKAWILPAALIVDAAVELLVLSYYYTTSGLTLYLMIATGALCFVGALMLGILNVIKDKENPSERKKKLKLIFAGVGLLGLVIAPTVWSGTTLFYAESSSMPSAGLELASSNDKGGNNGGMSSTENTDKLVSYLKAHTTNEKYLLAVSSANGYASDIIIKYGEPVMSFGGFSGSDNILTLNEFKQMVADGEIRYAMINGGGGAGGINEIGDDGETVGTNEFSGTEATGSNNEITAWIKANGKTISESEWSETASSTSTVSTATSQNADKGMLGGNSEQLYDLKQ